MPMEKEPVVAPRLIWRHAMHECRPLPHQPLVTPCPQCAVEFGVRLALCAFQWGQRVASELLAPGFSGLVAIGCVFHHCVVVPVSTLCNVCLKSQEKKKPNHTWSRWRDCTVKSMLSEEVKKK